LLNLQKKQETKYNQISYNILFKKKYSKKTLKKV
jgi:hypothetical protein